MKKTLFLLLLALLLWAAPASAMKDITIPDDAAEFDLSPLGSVSARDLPALADLLNAHPSLTACDLSGVRISQDLIPQLVQSCPRITFHAVMKLGGKKIDTLWDSLDLDGMHLSGKVSLRDLRQVMSCMPNLTQVVMVNAKFKLEDMEALFADYPRVHFEWTVLVNRMTFRPNATAYSTLKGRQDPRYTAADMAPVIKYCPDLLALDVGHNNVSDLSFLSAWPHLRRLIVIDSKVPVTDLSPLKDLDDLEYVELFLQKITDLSPLSGKTNLLDLNLCHNDVSDLTPLYSCTSLQRLWVSHNPRLTQEEIDNFKKALPNCQVETEVWSSTEAGWREHPRYFVMKDSFVSGIYQPFEESQPLDASSDEAPAAETAETDASSDETPAAEAAETDASSDEALAAETAETDASSDEALAAEAAARPESETVSAANEAEQTPPEADPAAETSPEALARDIGTKCLFNGISGAKHNLTDGTYARVFTSAVKSGVAALQIEAPEGEVIGGVQVQWLHDPLALDVQVQDESEEWVTVTSCDADFNCQYIPIPDLSAFRLVCRDNPHEQLEIAEIRVLTPGVLPDDIQLWEKPGDKVDLMLISGHPDDELLWFGGLLPWYASEQKKSTLVVVAAMNRSLRRLELLDALYACGVRIHPVFAKLADFVTKHQYKVIDRWGGEPKLLEKYTAYYRQYKPDVVMLQDINGEYGHGIHKTVSYLGRECIPLAADPTVYPDQVEKWGTWEIPKVYVHLYPENQIRMDWNRPMTTFPGKTALDVAKDAMLFHKSQLVHDWQVLAGGEDDNSIFGLYWTTVGPDVAKDDFFEHIPTAP